MARIINKKLKGSTLIEVTVAAVIMVIVFLLASTLVADLWKSGPSDRKMAAHTLLNKLAQQYDDEQDFNQIQGLPEGSKLEKESEAYASATDVQQITLTLKETESEAILDEVTFLYLADEKIKD